jgi:ABC-2 type transport system permease protein
MRAGFGSWWRTNTWWIHALIWTGVINGLIAGILWGGDRSSETGVAFLSISAGLFPTVAVVIIMMGEVVGEKKSGTAAWVLSKPVSREAFILSKWVPNIVGCVVTMILLPGLVAYVQIALAGEPVRPIGYLGGLMLLGLHLTFYLTLTLMLGTFFNSQAAVIAIPLALALTQQYVIGALPALVYVLPWMLVLPAGDYQPLTQSVMVGQPLYSIGPIVFAAVCIVIFIAVALWRFEREEL